MARWITLWHQEDISYYFVLFRPLQAICYIYEEFSNCCLASFFSDFFYMIYFDLFKKFYVKRMQMWESNFSEFLPVRHKKRQPFREMIQIKTQNNFSAKGLTGGRFFILIYTPKRLLKIFLRQYQANKYSTFLFFSNY